MRIVAANVLLYAVNGDARHHEAARAHVADLGRVLREVGVGGNLVNDAHLVALAVERRAEIVTYDIDFDRFPGVRWKTPEALLRVETSVSGGE